MKVSFHSDKGGGVMERLTKRNKKGVAVLNVKCPEGCEHSTCSMEEGYQCQHQCEGDIIEKLAQYEELEEQSLLLRLPCKVGDIVYRIINQRDNYDDTVYQIVSATIFELSMIDKIGKTVFLTKAEAEWKLKEMESD